MTDTWEITGSSSAQRSALRFIINNLGYIPKFEYLDSDTYNVTVESEYSDSVVEWAEGSDLPCRLI
jgi:hypothetical protein